MGEPSASLICGCMCMGGKASVIILGKGFLTAPLLYDSAWDPPLLRAASVGKGAMLANFLEGQPRH